MKLAEALIERAEIQKENAQLLNRMTGNVIVQEGDVPIEQPQQLIAEYEKNMERLLFLVQNINKTNDVTPFENGTIADAIAKRDCLKSKINVYRSIYEVATMKQQRYNANEIKFVRCIDAKALQHTINQLSKEYREIDTKLQCLNWNVDLIEK
ncbi:DIP1984 family protein [Lachnospiraceae bacterium 46-61]